MIKKYLEIIESLPEEEGLERQPQVIRIEVEDEADAKKKLKIYEPVFKGLKYVKRMLIQKHFQDADRNQPCEVKEL